MDLRVNHEELNNFYDFSRNESDFLREEIELWLEKIEELKDVWQGDDANDFYENVTSYFKRMNILPEFYDSVNEFVIGANRKYKEVDYNAKNEFQRAVARER